jgi:hypothetical protein
MAGFSREQVLALAPDAASSKAGQDLATPRKWKSLGGDGVALWGECQGSGAKPYQVQIELTEPAFKCSCPSRKFPCKHGLGLLLMFAGSPELFKLADQPAWVTEWLASRAERAEKKAAKIAQPEKPVDAEAQAARRAKRLDRITEGAAELKIWAEDLVRQGLATVPTKGYATFDQLARRMVDAQAPGVARRVQQLAETASSGGGWQRPFLEKLSLLHLLAQTMQQMQNLPADMQSEVSSVLGLATAQEQLAQLPGVQGVWQVIAQETEIEDRLRVQRSWLIETSRQTPVMILNFAHGTAALDTSLLPGTEFEAELVMFPGNGVRAAIRQRTAPTRQIAQIAGQQSIDDVLNRYSHRLAAAPFIGPIAFGFLGVTPARRAEQWFIFDYRNAALPLKARDDIAWTCMAVSGGGPIDLIGEFDGREIRPLALLHDRQYFSLVSSESGAA